MTPNKRFFGADPHRTSYKFADRLDCSSFKEFFDSQINAPVRLSESHSVFWQLSEKGRKAAKAVRFFVPGTFPDDRSEKNNGNVVSIALVCLDVDDSGDAAQILNNLPVAYEALGGLNFAIYTTASHTEEEPRCRIIVEAGGFDPEHYKRAVSWVAGRLGLVGVTSESMVPSQAMYRPTVFSDTDVAIEHPVVAHQTSMAAMEVEHFADAALLATLPRKGSAVDLSKQLEGLEYLEPKLDSVTLEDVKDALDATDPDIDMFSWIKVGMGMRHQFTEQDEEAFEVFNNWSEKGEKYDGEEKTRYRWEHFAANTSDRVPVTIRTMLLISKKAGWDNEAIQQKYYNDLVAYIEGIQTFSGLVERSLDRIAASPLLTPTLEESLLNHVVLTAKSSFGQKLSLASLKKSLRKKHSVLRHAMAEQSQKDQPLPSWAMNLAFISKTKQLVRLSTGEQLPLDSFDSTYGRELLPTKEQLEQMGESDNARIRNTPVMRPQDYVLNELQVPVAYDETYDPRQPDDAFIKEDGIKYVNTYTKTHPTPSDNQEDIDMVGEIFKSHISKLIAEPEYQTVLLDFLAHNVQLPGHKIRWAVLIQGGEGCGKGLLAQVLRTVMGEKHVASVDPEVLSSPYNDWAYGHALSVLNEIHSKGMSRYAVENKLKEPIADDKVSINQKFRDHRQINNRTNYIMFTNYHDALAISPNSRRYFVLQSPLQRKKDILALTETGHFDKVFGMVKEYPRALRAWFEQYKISDDFCADGPPPVTSYLKDMQQVTKPEAEQEFERILIDGDHAMVQRDLISSTTMLNVLNSELSKPTSGKHLASLLMAEGYKQHNVRITSGGMRHRMWVSEDADEIQAMNSKQLTELVRVRVEGVLDEDLESLG